MQSELSSSRPDKLVTARKVGLASLSAKELEAGGFRGEFAAASLKQTDAMPWGIRSIAFPRRIRRGLIEASPWTRINARLRWFPRPH